MAFALKGAKSIFCDVVSNFGPGQAGAVFDVISPNRITAARSAG